VVLDLGTDEEDGPETWEALTSPLRKPEDGDPA
jgi:hypothetical protein